MFDLIEISQGIKTFCFKSFIRKTISNFYYLKNFFEKTKYQNIIFLYLLFKPMQVICKGMNLQICL
jgi:hypothetical protein